MEYEITVSNVFEADTPEEAVLAMVAWVQEYATVAGYRVESFLDDSVNRFIDAESLDMN